MSSNEPTSRNDTVSDLLKAGTVAGQDGKCCRCHRTEHKDGTPITWKCGWCKKTVCRDCTLTTNSGISGRYSKIYYDDTLCSDQCWRYIGRPQE